MVVVNNSRRIVAHFNPSLFGESLDEDIELEESVEYLSGQNPRLVVWVPVGAGFRYGALQVDIDPRVVATSARSSALMTILVLVITFASLILGLSSLLNQSVAVPIRRLVGAVSRYRGDSPCLDLAPDGPDEVKQLLLAFNEMAAAVYRQTEELEQAVAERTGELRTVNRQLEEANIKLAELAVTDALTGIANRRAFSERLSLELERSRRMLSPLSLILFDIDHFKKLNDTQGHLEGDAALVRVAKLLEENSRSVDLAARWGGEEFVLLLPETSVDEAYLVGEKIRKRIQEANISGGVTISGGVAALPDHASNGEELLAAADLALYKAKGAGRNRIETPELLRRVGTEVAQ